MTATKTVHKLLARANRRMVDFDPGATAATIVDLDPTTSGEGLAIREWENFLFGVFRSVGTGTLSAVEVIAGTDADLSGATVVISHALGSAPNAVGDTIWLECDVEQIREVLDTATHVGLRITQAVAGDECVVSYEREGQRAYADNTADYIS